MTERVVVQNELCEKRKIVAFYYMPAYNKVIIINKLFIFIKSIRLVEFMIKNKVE